MLEAGKKVLVTGRKTAERVEIVVDGKSRWVTAGYLSEEKPPPRPPASSMAPAPTAPRRRERLSPNIVYVHQAVCASVPARSRLRQVARPRRARPGPRRSTS